MARISAAEKGRTILKTKTPFPEFNLIDYEMSLLKNLTFYNIEMDDNKKKKEWCLKYWTETGKDIKGMTRVPDYYFVTPGAVAHMIHYRELELDIKHITYLDKKYEELKAKITVEPQEVKAAPAIPKEDLELAAYRIHMAEFDNGIDMFFSGKEFDAKAYLVKNSVKSSISKKIAANLKTFLKEAKEAAAGKDEQLTEAYSFMPKRKLTKYIEYLQTLVSSCEVADAITKASRKPRAKKAKPPTELVKAVKWCAEDATSKMKSEHPAKIVNASEVWVYNIKNRRLFRYVSLSGMSLSVKGTTIVNMDAEKSGGKIIRKPESQLDGVQSMTSRPLNALYKEIRSTESRATGRLNEETLIVKCF